jgi:hypothetical protein
MVERVPRRSWTPDSGRGQHAQTAGGGRRHDAPPVAAACGRVAAALLDGPERPRAFYTAGLPSAAGPAPLTRVSRPCPRRCVVRELVLTGRTLDAAEALALHLVSAVAAPDDFAAEVGRWAEQLTRVPRELLLRTKQKIIRRAGEHPSRTLDL